MKRIKYLVLLLIVIVPVTIALFSSKLNTNAVTGEEALTAYAYELRLIKYEKQGDAPVQVGNSILIYHPDIFNDITGYQLHGPGNIPTTFDGFYDGTPHSGLTYLPPSSDSPDTAWSNDDPGSPDESMPTDAPLDESGGVFHTKTELECVSYSKKRSKSPASGSPGYDIHGYSWSCPAKRVNYYGKDVVTTNSDGSPKWSKMISDSSLTYYNITSKDYLRDLIVEYGGTREKIKNNFGYTIGDMEIHKYYIEAVPVHRIIESNVSNLSYVGQYLHAFFEKELDPPQDWTVGHWEDDIPDCPANYSLDGNKCKKCNCASGHTCNSSCKYTYCPSDYSSYSNCTTCDEDGENCVSHYTTGSGTWAYETPIPTYKLGDHCSGVKETHSVYGTEYNGPSYLVTAQETATSQPEFLTRAVNSCGTSDSRHEILDDTTGLGTGKYEHYIGPNKENGLVGIGSSYSRQLIGNCNSGASYDGYRDLYLIHIIDPDECKTKVCNSICNINSAECLRSDAYLNCAENFCESLVDYDLKGNARKRKKNCILTKCEYRYGRDPNTGSTDSTNTNLQSIDSCGNSAKVYNGGLYYDGESTKYKESIVNSYGKTSIAKFDSSCNTTLNSAGKYVPTQDIKGVYVTACKGDSVTDFNDDDTDDTTFDHRTYINSVCKIVSNAEFTDTSKLKLAAGLGFTYPIIQGGYEYCTYFINKEQWKFDYASIPARNIEYQRDRLLLILANFNDEVSKIDPDNSNMTEGTKALKAAGDLSNEGKTGFESNGFDFSSTTVSTTTTEYTVGTLNPKPVEELSKIEKDSTDGSLKSTAKLQTDARDYLKIVANGTITKKDINRYTSQSGGKITYTLKKVCIKTDGTADVYDAPGNNECYSTKITSSSGVSTETIHGSSTHYTSFKITPGKDNPIEGKVSVKAEESVEYYNVDDKCTYKLQSPGRCVLRVDTDGTKLGNKQYIANSATVTIIPINISNKDIASETITDGGVAIAAVDGKVTIKNNNDRSVETHDLLGTITLNDGSTVTCEEYIDLLTNPPTTCNASCSINKVAGDTSGKLYLLTVNNADLYYTFTTFHEIPETTEFTSRHGDSEPYSYMKEITQSVNDTSNGLYIRLDKALSEGEVLLGYVTNASNKKCNAYCYKPSDIPDSGGDCYKEKATADRLTIKEYCKENWSTDKNGFKDEEDCYLKCPVPCPKENDDLEVVDNYCNSYASYGYPAKEYCLNYCYKPTTITTGDEAYLFRQVNVMNPFPNSNESIAPYETGNRIVGDNWRQLSKFITNDEDDETTVTGTNANKKVEYIIDMTANDIAKIRENTSSLTENNGNTESNKRRVYSRLERITSGSDKVVSEYKSKFIRASDFSDLFKSSHGIGSTTVQATYPDGQ